MTAKPPREMREEEVRRAAREWVFHALRRDYVFYDEQTCHEFVDRAEGRTRVEAFEAGYRAAIRAARVKEG